MAKLNLSPEEIAQQFVGTPYYMAPELLLRQPVTYLADIWSLGISCIEMLTGQIPNGQHHAFKVHSPC